MNTRVTRLTKMWCIDALIVGLLLCVHPFISAGPDTARADEQLQPSSFAANPALPGVIPWFDLGAPTDANIARLIAGLGAWSVHSDPATPALPRAVVTVGAKYCDGVFAQLQQAVPEITLIPALTTSGIMGHSTGWDDADNWRDLAWWVWRAHEQLPDQPVLLENEYALRDYFQGKVDIDLNCFAEGLALLPTEVDYIWYPSAGGGGPKLERYMAVAAIVESVLEPIHFADHVSFYGYAYVHRASTYYAAARLQEIAAETVPIIYTENWGPDWLHVPEALAEVSRRWPGRDCYIYMNRGHWVSSAVRYAQLKAEGRR